MKKTHVALTVILVTLSFVIGHVTNCEVGKKEIAHDYSLDIDEQGETLIDNGRIVGRLNYGNNPGLDSLINKDNE